MKRNRNRNQVNASLSVTLTVLGGSFLAASPHPQEQQQELTREPGLGSDQFLAKLFPKSRPF